MSERLALGCSNITRYLVLIFLGAAVGPKLTDLFLFHHVIPLLKDFVTTTNPGQEYQAADLVREFSRLSSDYTPEQMVKDLEGLKNNPYWQNTWRLLGTFFCIGVGMEVNNRYVNISKLKRQHILTFFVFREMNPVAIKPLADMAWSICYTILDACVVPIAGLRLGVFAGELSRPYFPDWWPWSGMAIGGVFIVFLSGLLYLIVSALFERFDLEDELSIAPLLTQSWFQVQSQRQRQGENRLFWERQEEQKNILRDAESEERY